VRDHPDFRILLLVGLVVLVGLAGRALNRRHIIGRGISAQAYVLSVEVAARDYRYRNPELLYVVQLAIPRPDGTEIVAAVTLFKDPPQPGWTVPVRYIERLGNTTKVATAGPFTPVAEPQSLDRPDTL
jgi:hypothetical protein